MERPFKPGQLVRLKPSYFDKFIEGRLRPDEVYAVVDPSYSEFILEEESVILGPGDLYFILRNDAEVVSEWPE